MRFIYLLLLFFKDLALFNGLFQYCFKATISDQYGFLYMMNTSGKFILNSICFENQWDSHE